MSADELIVGKELPFTVEIANGGAIEARRTMDIMLGDEHVTTTELELAPGGSTTVTFETTVWEPGTYRLTVDEVPIHTLAVEEQATPTPTATPSPSPTPAETATPTSTETMVSERDSTPQTTVPDTSPTAEAESPGFGILTAAAGIGSILGYYLYQNQDEKA